jgi:hypothetical protein
MHSSMAPSSLEIVGWLVLGFGSYLSIFLHELGHAVMASRFARGNVYVVVGRMPGRFRFRRGRFGFCFDLSFQRVRNADGHMYSRAGYCEWQRTYAPRHEALIALGGPLATAGCLLVCLLLLALRVGAESRTLTLSLALLACFEAIALVRNFGAAFGAPDPSRSHSDGAKFRRARDADRRVREMEADLGRPLSPDELTRIGVTLLYQRRGVPATDGQAVGAVAR